MNYPYWCTTDLESQLAYPHYSDQSWLSGEREIFRLPASAYDTRQAIVVNYHDRLREWDLCAADRADAEAKGLRTAGQHQFWLEHYYGYPITLVWIATCIHRSSGYPVWVYGYYATKGERC